MCGRYSLTSPEEALRRLFGYEGPALNIPPRYNVAPSQEMPVVKHNAEKGRGLVTMRWGLIPSWADDEKISYKMINARGETVAEKPSFRAAFKARRCLVPADGFYEWHAEGGVKQPYRIAYEDNRPFAFAGLWEVWEGADGPVRSYTIVTTDANDALKDIHHRMPVVIEPESFGAWLDAEATAKEDALALLETRDYPGLRPYKVSTEVNNVKNDTAALLEPV